MCCCIGASTTEPRGAVSFRFLYEPLFSTPGRGSQTLEQYSTWGQSTKLLGNRHFSAQLNPPWTGVHKCGRAHSFTSVRHLSLATNTRCQPEAQQFSTYLIIISAPFSWDTTDRIPSVSAEVHGRTWNDLQNMFRNLIIFFNMTDNLMILKKQNFNPFDFSDLKEWQTKNSYFRFYSSRGHVLKTPKSANDWLTSVDISSYGTACLCR